jgi:hypothetical protein
MMAWDRLSAEEQLCLFLSVGCPSGSFRDRASELSATPLNWEIVVQYAVREGTFPLLYRNLRALGFPGGSPGVRVELASLARHNALRNALLANELGRVLELFAGAGIPAIPWKGVALAQALYGDEALRCCGDIDILVRPADVARALDALAAKGYLPAHEDRVPRNVTRQISLDYAVRRHDPGIDYLIELHWGVLGVPALDRQLGDEIWSAARPTTFAGARAFAPNAEHELLCLAAHAAKHWWKGLKWLVDIHDLCCSRSIDWQTLRQGAERLQCARVIRFALSACHELLDTRFPAEFAPALPPGRLCLFPTPWSPSDSFRAVLFASSLLKRRGQRANYVIRRILSPTDPDRDFVHLPHSLGWLYYPIRLFRLAWRQLRAW